MKPTITEAQERPPTLPNISPLDLHAKPYLSIEESSILTGLSAWTIRHAYRKGQLRAAKIGGRVVIDKSDLVAFIEQSKEGVAKGEYPCIAKRRKEAQTDNQKQPKKA